MKKLFFISMVCLLASISTLTLAQAGDKYVLLASTIGPVDAGLVPLLEDKFESETGIRVRHVGGGGRYAALFSQF